jgi:hypothetical protein
MKIFANFRSAEEDITFNILKDKFGDKPITFFYDYIPQTTSELQLNPYNFIMVHEPNEFFGMHDWVKQNNFLFNIILTWNKDILDNCENSFKFTCNYQQDSLEYYNSLLNTEKIFEVSFLSGTKTLSEGHQFRNEIYKIKDQINIPKKWFYVLEDFDIKNNVRPGYNEYSKDLSHIPEHLQKIPQVYGKRVCYEKPMFHVCIENIKQDNWYTEKIGEAFCTKTVPIYWGCPNIGEYYDERGIIAFNTKGELLDIINNLTPKKYIEMKPYIDYNYEVALCDSFTNKLTGFFEEIIKINNI